MNLTFKKSHVFIVSLLMMILYLFMSMVPVHAEGFQYIHDPRENCNAMKDIVVDPNAVYGFRPSDTGSLKQFGDLDWSDPAVVEKNRQKRLAYFDQYQGMYDMLIKMVDDGRDTEYMARKLSEMRNKIRMDSYKNDPEGMKKIKARNLEKYGNENGPTPEYLYEKFGSWEMVLLKSFSENAGMDACLGLYDERYPYYELLGTIKEHESVIAEGVPATEETTGLTEGRYCRVCGYVIEAQREIPKIEKPIEVSENQIKSPPTGITQSKDSELAVLLSFIAVMLGGSIVVLRRRAKK